jgi:uncharacterized protein with beta-barrel porin domain
MSAAAASFSYGGAIAGTGGNLVHETAAAPNFSTAPAPIPAPPRSMAACWSVNGSIANSSSLTTVNAGGTLGGTGTVGNTIVNGGTLAPGQFHRNAIGTLTVSGNLAFTTAALYLVQVGRRPSTSMRQL